MSSFLSMIIIYFKKHFTLLKATTTSVKTTHHIGSTNNFDCNGKVSGFYADPSSCTQYFICAGVQSFRVSCASGLMFNAATDYCDWPANVNCKVHSQSTTRAPPATNPPQTTHGNQHVTTTTQAPNPTTQSQQIPNSGIQSNVIALPNFKGILIRNTETVIRKTIHILKIHGTQFREFKQ